MPTNGKAPESPGFIDRVRALVAKIFGSPGRTPRAAEHAAAGSLGAPISGRPAGKPTRSTAAEAATPRA